MPVRISVVPVPISTVKIVRVFVYLSDSGSESESVGKSVPSLLFGKKKKSFGLCFCLYVVVSFYYVMREMREMREERYAVIRLRPFRMLGRPGTTLFGDHDGAYRPYPRCADDKMAV